MRTLTRLALGAAALAMAGCATLGLAGLVRPPRFDRAPGRPAELRLGGLGSRSSFGVARVRTWARVSNPNTFGLTLSTLQGDLFLEDRHAATIDLPLGLPLVAGEETEFPIELSIGLSDIPALAGLLGRALSGDRIPYQIEGTIGVDAGPLGRPTFGPLKLLDGDLDVVR